MKEKSNKKRTRIDSNELNRSGLYHSTPFDQIDDFSDIVAFYLKSDQIAHGEAPTDIKMSEKKCPFCC